MNLTKQTTKKEKKKKKVKLLVILTGKNSNVQFHLFFKI